MPKGLILLNKDYSISYCKMKNLPTDLNPKKTAWVMLPILGNEEGMQKFLVLKAKNLITHFKSCVIRFFFRIEFFVDDVLDPIIMEPLEFHPDSITSLYEVLHNLNIMSFAFNVMNQDATYSQYFILDIQRFDISIKGSNFGDHQASYVFDEKDMTEGRYLHCENILEMIKDIFFPINITLGQNERIHLYHDTWETTKAINDDGMYGLKLYPNSITLIDEETYKMFKRMFPKKRDSYMDILVYDKEDLNLRDLDSRHKIFVPEQNVLNTYMYRIYSPDDLIETLLYYSQIKNIVMLIEKTIFGNDTKIGISFIYTFMGKGTSYRLDYGEYPDEEYGNIEIVLRDTLDKSTNLVENFYNEYRRQEKMTRGE